MKVKFLEDREVADGEGVVYQRFKAGQVVELSNASARHWITRNAALEVQGSTKTTVTPVVVSPTFPKRGRGRPRSVSPLAPASDKPK